MSKPEPTNQSPRKSAAANAAAPAKKPSMMLVLDTTATDGPRTHEQIVDGVVKPYTFERGKPLDLPPAIAIKFLKDPAFKLVNEKGEIIPFRRRPRQPDELGAGETFTLAPDQTIARFDELSSAALLQRAVELPGGEKFAQGENKPERAAMIEFIVAAIAERKRASMSRERDIGEGEFLPEAEIDDSDSESEAA